VQTGRFGCFPGQSVGYVNGVDDRSDEGFPRFSLSQFSFADHLALWLGCFALLGGIASLAFVPGGASEAIGVPLLSLCGCSWFFLLLLLIGEGEERHRRKGGS
jgi:hypothetical protein